VGKAKVRIKLAKVHFLQIILKIIGL